MKDYYFSSSLSFSSGINLDNETPCNQHVIPAFLLNLIAFNYSPDDHYVHKIPLVMSLIMVLLYLQSFYRLPKNSSVLNDFDWHLLTTLICRRKIKRSHHVRSFLKHYCCKCTNVRQQVDTKFYQMDINVIQFGINSGFLREH